MSNDFDVGDDPDTIRWVFWTGFIVGIAAGVFLSALFSVTQ